EARGDDAGRVTHPGDLDIRVVLLERLLVWPDLVILEGGIDRQAGLLRGGIAGAECDHTQAGHYPAHQPFDGYPFHEAAPLFVARAIEQRRLDRSRCNWMTCETPRAGEPSRPSLRLVSTREGIHVKLAARCAISHSATLATSRDGAGTSGS